MITGKEKKLTKKSVKLKFSVRVAGLGVEHRAMVACGKLNSTKSLKDNMF